ncbi:pyrimidine/purine nucleotide monophosphate nucleosidase domain-containing protein, partial [Pseudohongiella sp.]
TGIDKVARNRRKSRDAYYYNWLLNIPQGMKDPFEVSHESMAALKLTRDLPVETLAVNLRRAFSGIVAGNVKDKGVRLVRQHGPFELRGERVIMDAMDSLLRDFVADGRMKILREQYNPCYTVRPL